MNTPNKITLSRILLIPLIVFFYLASFIPYGRLVSAILFMVASLTDFIDGKIARATNQVTDLGKFFDAIADKVLTMTGFILIVAVPITGSAPVVWPAWLGVVCVIAMLAREFIISALRQLAAAKGKVLAADMSGKIKATLQFISICLYMFYAFFLTDIYPMVDKVAAEKATGIIGLILMIILACATVLTIYSGVHYLVQNKFVFKDSAKNIESKTKNRKIKEQKKSETEMTEED